MPSEKNHDFLDFVLDQLAGLRGVTSRRMFGAIGIYQGDHFFAIIDEGRLYFLTGEATRARYVSMGAKPFEYAPGKLLRTYYEVPVDIIEDDIALSTWAREAVDVQKRRGKRRRREREGPRHPQTRGGVAPRRRHPALARDYELP